MTNLEPPRWKTQDGEERYMLTLSGLSEKQYDELAGAIKQALDPSGGLWGKIVGRVVGTAVCSVGVAACIWLVFFITANLPGR